MDLIFGALKNFSTGNRAMYSGTNLTPYELQKHLYGVRRLGGALDYLPVCSEDHSASMLRWDGLCSQKRSYSGAGGEGGELVVRSLFFLIPIFHITSSTPTPRVVRMAFISRFQKIAFSIWAFVFFSSDLENSHFQFLIFFWFL